MLDIKPYLPFAEAVSDATTGWIGKDPDPPYAVQFSERAEAQIVWLEAQGVVDLRRMISERLAIGPEPKAYRRIRREGDLLKLAVHAWRATFHAHERTIVVDEIATGYKSSSLTNEQSPEVELHRGFVQMFF